MRIAPAAPIGYEPAPHDMAGRFILTGDRPPCGFMYFPAQSCPLRREAPFAQPIPWKRR